MVKESDFQTKFARELKNRGFVVLKYNQNATTRAGVPDLAWYYKKAYGFCEIKRKKPSASDFQPLQEKTLARLSEWCSALVVFPENYQEVMSKLLAIADKEDQNDNQ